MEVQQFFNMFSWKKILKNELVPGFREKTLSSRFSNLAPHSSIDFISDILNKKTIGLIFYFQLEWRFVRQTFSWLGRRNRIFWIGSVKFNLLYCKQVWKTQRSPLSKTSHEFKTQDILVGQRTIFLGLLRERFLKIELNSASQFFFWSNWIFFWNSRY